MHSHIYIHVDMHMIPTHIIHTHVQIPTVIYTHLYSHIYTHITHTCLCTHTTNILLLSHNQNNQNDLSCTWKNMVAGRTGTTVNYRINQSHSPSPPQPGNCPSNHIERLDLEAQFPTLWSKFFSLSLRISENWRARKSLLPCPAA